MSQGSLVLGWDFNCIDSVIDRLNIQSDFGIDRRVLSALKAYFCLADVWRKRNPSAISYTWAYSDFSEASRLDRFLISRSLLSLVHSNKCFPCTLSDHDYVDLLLSPCNGNPTGAGFGNLIANFWLTVILLVKCMIFFFLIIFLSLVLVVWVLGGKI